MDSEKQVSSLTTFFSEHKMELMLFAFSTIAYQLYLKHQQSKQDRKRVSLKSKVLRRKSVDYKFDRRKSASRRIIQSPNCLVDQIKFLISPQCNIQRVKHLIPLMDFSAQDYETILSPLSSDNSEYKNLYGGQGFIPEESFVYKGSYVLARNIYISRQDFQKPTCWLLAGPRKHIHWHPQNVKAAIVTCGGLCPGLNVVIRQIFITLSVLYGVPEIYGIKFGYMGFYSGEEYWNKLDMHKMKYLQYLGGTFLGSSRGGFDAQKIINACVQKGINHLYVIGGDGTHRGILQLTKQISKRKLQVCIAGIPKTIDNDIPIIDKSFGFETAVAESIRAIRSAYVESRGVQYGIGLVRLMGRDAGFIAMQATNASRDVDICLIPEFQFDLHGTYGVLNYVYEQLKIKKHMVIVVAEGASTGVRDQPGLLQSRGQDASGNIKKKDLGAYLKGEIIKYCEEKQLKATLKYIDPTYMIRTVPANSYDRRMCAHLAASAVHGAMAGFTAFTVGQINGSMALIPIDKIGAPNRITTGERGWQRVLATTGQPTFQNPQNQKKE